MRSAALFRPRTCRIAVLEICAKGAPQLIRLDREGLEYLLQVCADIGFGAISIETFEDLQNAPEVSIKFRQTRIAEVPKKEPQAETPQTVIDDNSEMMLDGTKL